MLGITKPMDTEEQAVRRHIEVLEQQLASRNRQLKRLQEETASSPFPVPPTWHPEQAVPPRFLSGNGLHEASHEYHHMIDPGYVAIRVLTERPWSRWLMAPLSVGLEGGFAKDQPAYYNAVRDRIRARINSMESGRIMDINEDTGRRIAWHAHHTVIPESYFDDAPPPPY